MRNLRLFFTVLLVILSILAMTVLLRWIKDRDSTELTPQSSNVEYIRWQLPKGAKARLGKGSINDIKYSPDGTRFAVATTIGVWMYDAQTGADILLFKGDRQDIKGIAFSADGSSLIGANSAAEILKWNVQTGELHATQSNENLNSLHSAVFSDDGTKLASTSRSMFDAAQVWNIDNAQTTPTITNIKLDVKRGRLPIIALTPDKRFLATAIIDSYSPQGKNAFPIQVRNADTRERLFTLTGHERWIKSLAFSPDGKTLASGDEYETIKLWDMDTATARATFKASVSFYSLSFSPNGKLLASGSGRGRVHLWNAESKQEGWRGAINKYVPTLKLKAHKAKVTVLTFSPDGNMLLTGSDDGTIRAWNTTTGKQQFVQPGWTPEISGLATSDDGRTLITVHSRKNQLLRWDIDIGHHLSGVFFKSKRPEAISPDGKIVAIKDWNGKNTIKLWDTSKKRVKTILKGAENPRSTISTFEFSLNGNRLATIKAYQGTRVLHLWDISNSPQSFLEKFFRSKKILPRWTFQMNTEWARELAFSSNGKILASCMDDRTILIMDVEIGSPRWTLATEHERLIRALAFSPNGKTLVSGGNYRTFYLWDVTTGQQLTENNSVEPAKTLQFSPDGETIVSGTYSGKIQLLDAETLHLLSTHTGHTSWVNALLFIEDDKTLVSASQDGTILLWDWDKIRQEND